MNNIKFIYINLSSKGKCRENWSSDNPTLFKRIHKIYSSPLCFGITIKPTISWFYYGFQLQLNSSLIFQIYVPIKKPQQNNDTSPPTFTKIPNTACNFHTCSVWSSLHYVLHTTQITHILHKRWNTCCTHDGQTARCPLAKLRYEVPKM
jgi:hypothetical protein